MRPSRRIIARRGNQTALNEWLTIAQTVFNRPLFSPARQDPAQRLQTARFRVFSRTTAILPSGNQNVATRHKTASRRRTGKIKGRATSTTAVNPTSTQSTLQPHTLKIQAKSKQMYFSFCRPSSRLRPSTT